MLKPQGHAPIQCSPIRILHADQDTDATLAQSAFLINSPAGWKDARQQQQEQSTGRKFQHLSPPDPFPSLGAPPCPRPSLPGSTWSGSCRVSVESAASPLILISGKDGTTDFNNRSQSQATGTCGFH